MRLAYDSITAADIPANAQIVAGYCDGRFSWSNADWARFPNVPAVRIACFASTNDGQVLDVETGCAAPAEAPDWVLKRRAAGVDPTVYVNWSNWDLTRAAFIQQGVAQPHWWLASYDGVATIPAGAVAKQYANSSMSGGHYDLSVVADYWPGVDRPWGSTTPAEIPVLQEVPMTDAELVTMHHLIQFKCFGQVDPSGQADFVNSVRAGVGMNTIMDGWDATPQAAAWRARLAAAGTAGPQGPEGPPGPPGPPGITPKQFNIVGTAEAV